MGQNRAYDRSFFVIGGSVRTSGGSEQLVNGQLGVADMFSATDDGATLLSSFVGLPKDKKNLALRLGIAPIDPNRSKSNKAKASAPFSLNEIKKLRKSVPERTEMIMDEVILGYDGFNADTSMKFKVGQKHLRITLELKNGVIQYRGGQGDTELVHVNIEIPDCDPFDECLDCDTCASVDCRDITLQAIERLRSHQISGGMTVDQFVDITPVFGNCDTPATAVQIPYTYYTLDVCDTGDNEALALVAGQYGVPVIRIARTGSTSTYQMLLADSAGAPDDYEQTVASVIKGCATCPAGYTEVPGGFLYAITIVDNGVDNSAVIAANLAAAKLVVGTVIRGEGSDGSIGMYTAVYTSPITAAEIASFVGTSVNARNTATVSFVSDIASFCEDDTVTPTSWVAGETCNAIEETYSIVLPDTVCGETRLAELQGAYAGLTIAVADSPTLSEVDVTITAGTGGTLDITIDGVVYVATFAVDFATTAANFVTTHAAALLAAGFTVSSVGAVITVIGLTADLAGITAGNESDDLAATVGAVSATPDRRNCSTRYTTSIISNLVCEECSPIFLDFYRTVAPNSFGTHQWTKDANPASLPSGNCLCGIRFKGKPFILSGDEALSGIVAFTESGTEVRVSGGYPDEIREGIGVLEVGTYPTYWISSYTPRTHLYGNLRDIEREGNVYFKGGVHHSKYLTRILLGETAAVQDNVAQAIVYYLEVKHNTMSNGFAGEHATPISYNVFVEVGKHQAVENLLNDLASNAGIPMV